MDTSELGSRKSVPQCKIRIGSADFAVTNPKKAAEYIVELANNPRGQGHHVHLANAFTLALADGDDELRRILAGNAINFADGRPITWVARLLRRSKKFQQIRGPQLFEDVINIGRTSELRHYLLGSTENVLDNLEKNIQRKFPGTVVVGRKSPKFRQLSAGELAIQDEDITSCQPDIVWVGLGTPKQDFEAARLASVMPVVAVGVGAAFDFTAGSLKPAPRWMSITGLEWTHRLSREPRRLWKRYLLGNLGFVKAVLNEAIRE